MRRREETGEKERNRDREMEVRERVQISLITDKAHLHIQSFRHKICDFEMR